MWAIKITYVRLLAVIQSLRDDRANRVHIDIMGHVSGSGASLSPHRLKAAFRAFYDHGGFLDCQ
jgi:F420-dependent methylenetetrahydromethanopterin dehydrogenase